MKCSLFRLFPLVIEESLCGGESVTMNKLSKVSAVSLLKSIPCYRKGNDSMAEVIVNKLTPDQHLDLTKLSDLDVCLSHRNS